MKNKALNIAAAALVAAALSEVPAFAAGTDTWVGNTDANWSTAANWTTAGGSTPPANGDSLMFGTAGSAGTSLNNDLSGLSLNKLTFSSGASSFTFSGNGFTNGTGGINASALSSGTETISVALTPAAGVQRWNVGTGATLALGSLPTQYGPAGGMVIISKTGTKTTTAPDGWNWRGGAVANTGLTGPGFVIDNGDNTFDWASAGNSGGPIVAATYTTAANSDAHNVKVIANTTVTPNASWASLLVQGATLTHNGANLYIDTGIILQTGGTIGGSGPIKANNDGLYIYVPDNGTINSSIQNNGANAKLLYKAGTGTLSLNGNNSYSGGTYLYEGTISLGNASALGSGVLNLNGGNLDSSVANLSLNNIAQNWNADFTFVGSQNLNLGSGAVTLGATRQVTVSSNTLTVGGAISGAGFGLTKVGNGTLALAGANTYTGNTTVNAGTLRVSPPGNAALLHLSFDNVSGSTVNNEGSGGAAMNGTLNGSASIVSGGQFGNCLQISGANASSASCRVANSVVPLNVGSGNNWTVAMWVKSSTAGGCYAYQGDGGWSSGNTTFYLNTANTTGTQAGGVRWGQNWETGTASINDGNWHHVVLECSGTTKTAYVDGNVDAFTANAWNSTGTGGQFWVGGAADTGDGTANLNGNVDEVYIYNRALSQAEVQQLYSNNSISASPTIPAGSVVTVNTNGTLLLDSNAMVASSSVTVSGGTISGAGTISGNTTINNNGALTPRPAGGSATTLTFGGNVSLANASANFTLSTSAAGANDKVIYGGTLTVNNTDTINITNTTLDAATDYILFGSSSGSVSMATRPTLKINGVTSDQTTPGQYQLVASGTSLKLHYIQAAVPPTVNSTNASPAVVQHYQTTTLTVNVTPASGKSISSVTVTIDGLGGAGDPTTLTGPGGNGAGNWTGVFTVPGSLAVGSYSVSGVVNQSDGGTAAWSVNGIIVTNSSPIWNGAGADNKWSTGGNWNIGRGPGTGDSATFAGSVQLTNNLDASLGLTSLTFNSGSGSFDITNSANTLTLTGGLTNNSVNPQTLEVPVTVSGTPTINVAAGNVAITRPVSGGSFAMVGNNTLVLTGTNTFTGGVTVSSGTFEVAGTGQLGAGNYAGNMDVESLFKFDSSAGQNLSGAISGAGMLAIANSTLTLSGANSYSGGTTISNAVVAVGNGTGLGTGMVTLNGGTVQNAAGIGTINDIYVGPLGGTIKLGNASDFWVGGNLMGTGNLVLGGASPGVNSLNVNFSANTLSSGSITIPPTGNNQTVVRFKTTTSGNSGVSWSVGGAPDRFVTLDFGGGTIEFGALTGAGVLAGNGGGTKIVQVGGMNSDSTFGGKFLDGSGVLQVNKVGTGKLTLSGSGTAISGGIYLYDGILNLGSANPVGGATTFTFSGGMLQYSAASQADYGSRIVNSLSPIFIDLNGTNVTFATAIPNNNYTGLVLTNSTGIGKLTLTANNLYYGDTYINASTLALSGSGNISGTANIIVSSNGVLDVSSATAYTLGSGQTLSGVGVVTGAVTTASSSATISPGGSGYGNPYGAGTVGNLTFKNNLTMNAGGSAVFDLSDNHLSGNDQVVVNGNLRLSTSDTIHINAMTSGGNLDETGDYVLFSVNGTLTMTSIPVLTFDSPPADAANWWIKASGNNVVLHYSVNPPPIVTTVIVTNIADSSSSVVRGQSVGVYAVVQKTLNNISSVTVDLSSIGGSATQPMTLVTSSGDTFEYSYSPALVGPSAIVGADSIGVAATDTSAAVGTGAATLYVNATTETWNGSASDDNWSSAANWSSGFAPGYAGDALTFTGNTRLTPNLEANYDVTSLTFDGGADSFTIGSTSGKSLTLSGPLYNYSPNPEAISAPVVLTAGTTLVDSGAGLTLSGPVSGTALTVSSGMVTLGGTNTYTGDTVVSSGTLRVAGSAAIPSGAGKGNVILAGGTTLDVNGTNVSMNGLSNAGNIDNLGLDPATVTIGNGNASSAYGGMIVNSLGPISLVKVGSGAFTIGKNNLYSGDTKILGGSVVLPNGSVNAFSSGTVTLSNAALVVQAGGGGTWNSANACFLGNSLVVPSGTTNIIDDSANNFGNLWVGGDAAQWTGAGVVKFQNNGNVNNPGLIWNGSPLANFNGSISLDSATGTNSSLYNGIAYSGSASGGTGAAVTTFDAHGTAWGLGDIAYTLTQVIDPGCSNVKLGSISGSNTNTILRGSSSSSAQTMFEIGAAGGNTSFAGKITDWGSGGTALTKVGSGSLTLLSTANTYTGPTTVSNGTLLVNGAITSPVAVFGGTFGGTGTVGGSVAVNAGGTLSPGASVGTLTINGNLMLAGNALVELNKSLSPAQSNDFVNVTGALSYGGTLTVNNLGPALGAGNSFRIFPSGGTGTLTVLGNPGAGLAYNFNDGVLSVVTGGPSGPATITNSISGNTLNLTWPAGQGWRLQAQTNNLSTGLQTNGWVNVTTTDGSYNATINPANPSVFYRLVNP